MVTKKDKKEKGAEKNGTADAQYFYAVGKRKTAIAQVRVYPTDKPEKGVVINDRKVEEYFPVARWQETVKAPLAATGHDVKADVTVKVAGGGVNAQAEAVRLGISRALVKLDMDLKKSLRDLGFLTRDARIVERKKPGLKKARRAPQWAKR